MTDLYHKIKINIIVIMSHKIIILNAKNYCNKNYNFLYGSVL